MGEPTPIYQPRPGEPMRVAGLLSGSGTNLVKLIEHEKKSNGAFEIAVIFTDTPESRASVIAAEHGIPCVTEDINAFYLSRGFESKKDLSLRPEFDLKVVEALRPLKPDLLVLAGYMSIVTAPLLDAYSGRIVNVHPADLSLATGGRRTFTGAHCVRDAIRAGRRELRSSTHIVRSKVDYGEILLISEPVAVELPADCALEELRKKENRRRLKEISGEHQERLKEKGDWTVLPLTVEWISRGRFGFMSDGKVSLDGTPFLQGARLEDLR